MPTDPIRLKNPIVLIHGLGARSAYGPFEYFYGLPKRLRSAGNPFYIANLASWHTIEYRAEQLKKQIDEVFPDTQVNLLCHSMGGLDARYLVSQLGFAERVASITTIGTPHRGSIAGDIASGLLPNEAFQTADKLLRFLDLNSGGFKQITSKYSQEVFDPLCPQMPGVTYFSASSAIGNPLSTSLPIFWLPHQILKQYEGDNDGFVSVESSKHGEHICTYRGDHYAQIGQFLGYSRGLDYIKFYDEILKKLKRENF